MAGADEAGETRSQAPEQTSQEPEQANEPAAEPRTPQAPGFGERGRMRRRARFLRKARELAYRDLGGLVFDLHRFGQRNDPLVLAKLAALRHIDTELRQLEEALNDRRPVTVLREVGIAACPRCAAIHDSDDRFCPGCGLAFDTNADRPISTGPVVPQAQIAAQISTPPASQPSGAPAQISAAPAQISPPTQPKIEQAPLVKPRVEPAPPVKPTAPPIAAKPPFPPASSTPAASERPGPDRPGPARPGPERAGPERAEEDEPTQILRPPARGS